MRTGFVAMLGSALLLATAFPANAQDSTGYRAIAAGDLANAERALIAERRIFPRRPELMLNLAAVYARTGRDAQARALYDSTLAMPAVEMDMPSGAIVSSHAVAQMGLAKLPGAQIAAR